MTRAPSQVATWIVAISFLLSHSAFSQDRKLTPYQDRLIVLNAYLSVAVQRCDYAPDPAIGLTNFKAGLKGETEPEKTAFERERQAAWPKFDGTKGPVECAYALEQYGPTGSVVAGLIRRRP